MARSSTGFGKRQGGLAQPYRSGVAIRSEYSPPRNSPAPAKSKFNAPPEFNSASASNPTRQSSQPWGQPAMEPAPGGAPNLYGVKHPIFMRFVSAAVDGFILILLTFMIMAIFDVSGTVGPVPILENTPLTLTLAVIWFGYGLLFESSSWQGTPGKKVTGLVITDMDGQKITFGRALGRAFGKVFSSILPLYIPYIMVGMTERRQSLHDKMCGTLVFRRYDLARSNSVFD